MDRSTYDIYLDILRRELVCALGCTEPIAVAYVAALARDALGACRSTSRSPAAATSSRT